MPEGPLASAFVEVKPDLEGFEAELRSELDAALSGDRGKINVGADTTQARADIEAEIARLKTERADMPIGADTSEVDRKIDELRLKLDELTLNERDVKIGADTAEADAKLLETKAAADAASGFGGGGGGIGGLAAAGLALGPALLPVAGAVTAGLGAMLVPLTAASVGFGALGIFAIPAIKDISANLKTTQPLLQAFETAQPGPAQAQAWAALEANIAKLPPEMRPVVQGIVDIQLEIRNLAQSAGINQALYGAFAIFLNDIKILLPQIAPFAREAALALGDLGTSVGKGLGSPAWEHFVFTIVPEIRPAIDAIGRSFGELVKGIGGLVEAFAPMAGTIESGMVRVTTAFANWATNLGGSQGFQTFMQWVKDNARPVGDAIKNIADALVSIVRASAGLGGVEIRALSEVAQAINAIASVPGVGPAAVDIGLLAFAVNKFIPLAAVPAIIRGIAVGLKQITDLAGLGGAASGISAFTSALGGLAAGTGFAAIGAAMAGGILDAFSKSFDQMITRNVPQWAADLIHGFSAAAVIVVSSVAAAAVLPVVAIMAAFDEGFRNTIKQHVPRWVGSVLDAIASVPKAIENFFVQTIPQAFEAGFAAVSHVVTTAVAPVVNAVAGAWHTVESVTTTVWNAITGFLSQWWHALILVFGPIGVIVDFVTTNWHAIANITTSVFSAVAGFLSGIWNAIAGAVSAAVGVVTRAIQGAWAFVQGVTTAIWQAISGFLSGIWNAISGAASAVFNTIRSVITAIWDSIQGSTSGIWSGISGFLSGIWGGISGTASSVFGTIKSVITTTMDEIGTAIHTVWDGMSSFFSGVWDGIKTAFSTGVDAVGAVVNPFIDVADKALSLLGVNINIPDLPHLAEGGSIGGGFVTRGPTAVVGEGKPAWPEFVIPTDPAYRDRAQNLYSDLGAKLGAGCGGACGMAAGGLLSGHEIAAYAGAGVPLAGFGLHTIVGGAERIGGDIISGGKAILHGISDVAGEAAAVVRGAAGDVLRTLAGSIGWPWPVPPVFEGTIPAFANKGVQGMIDLVAGKQAAKSAAGGGSGIGGAGPAVTGACGDWVRQGLAFPGANAGFGEACMMARVMNESGCNPGAVNNWDSNAAAGHPSVGLAQFVPSTFAATSCPGCTDINNPVCQVCASSHCSPGNCGHGGYGCASGGILGLANGGIVRSPTLAAIGEAGPEAVVPLGQGGAFGGVTINAPLNLTVQGDMGPQEVAAVSASHDQWADLIVSELNARGFRAPRMPGMG